MKIPRIVIAGTNSGCGKTTLSMGIMAAFAERGLKVQPYKVGPDYIDPMFHTFITGRESRNLDSWLLPEGTVRHLFAKSAADADIAVVEGVMGFYDGYGGRSLEGSTAHVAEILKAPVILVINGEAMSLSAAALVKGFAEFHKGADVKGVIINNLNGEAHYRLLKEIIEENTGIAVAGYLKRNEDISIADRHLGLVTSAEIGDLKERAGRLTEQIRETVDLELLMKLAGEAEDLGDVPAEIPELGDSPADLKPGDSPIQSPAPGTILQPRARIAVARDKAFCFYYRDNLDLLEQLGAELVYFSPLADSRLPDNIDGLYLGGGYPEIHAEELQTNEGLRSEIKCRCEAGLPAYAECGGMMYLSEGIDTLEGHSWEMAGVFRCRTRMTKSLKRFGYVFLQTKKDNILAPPGAEIRAHEFHYSEAVPTGNLTACFELARRKDGGITQQWECGYKVANVLAGYPHLHFWSNPEFAVGFVNSCGLYRKKCGSGADREIK